MADFCYLIESADGVCLNLSADGPRQEPRGFSEKLKREGFQHVEDRPLGTHFLRVYRKQMLATDLVPPE